MTHLWADLVKHIRAGEALIEGNLEHEAILVARKMDADRRLAEEQAGKPVTAVDTAVVEPPKPTPAPAPEAPPTPAA